jgi:hypothetical protein
MKSEESGYCGATGKRPEDVPIHCWGDEGPANNTVTTHAYSAFVASLTTLWFYQ